MTFTSALRRGEECTIPFSLCKINESCIEKTHVYQVLADLHMHTLHVVCEIVMEFPANLSMQKVNLGIDSCNSTYTNTTMHTLKYYWLKCLMLFFPSYQFRVNRFF